MLSVPHGIENRFYQLQMDNGGLIDLNQLESLIDMRTRAIIVNNPSNPTGVVFPADHLEALLEIARRHNVCFLVDFYVVFEFMLLQIPNQKIIRCQLSPMKSTVGWCSTALPSIRLQPWSQEL
jgi:bifunctional pyridoxal-dependent enzyme with beta-cystathionase and maltose regulon repressor activities